MEITHPNMIPCPECRSTNTIHDEECAESYCGDCGIVLPEKTIDTTTQTSTTQTSTTHTPVPRGEKATTMGVIPQGADSSIYRMQKQDAMAARVGVPSAARSTPMRRLRAIHERLGLPESAFTTAADMYIKARTKGSWQGIGVIPCMAAAIYLSCRAMGIPRTIRDISMEASITRKELSRAIRHMLQRGAERPAQHSIDVIITRIANMAAMSTTCRDIAIKNAAKLSTTYLLGKNPHVISAALLYIAAAQCGEECTQTYLAEISGVSSMSIRMRAREVMSNSNIIYKEESNVT